MSLLQVYKNNEIEYIGFDCVYIQTFLQKLGIIFYPIIDLDFHDMSEIYKIGNFIRHDIIRITQSMDLNFHCHTDDEARVVIDGEVIFMIILDNNYRIELKVSRGDYMSIPKNMVHTVIIKEPVKVLRLFTSMDDYKAIPYE